MPRANRYFYQAMFGTLHTVVIKKSFYLSLLKIVYVGGIGYLKPENGMGFVY